MNQTKFAIAALAIILSGVAAASAPRATDARASHALSATTTATTTGSADQAARVPSGDPHSGPRRICCMW